MMCYDHMLWWHAMMTCFGTTMRVRKVMRVRSGLRREENKNPTLRMWGKTCYDDILCWYAMITCDDDMLWRHALMICYDDMLWLYAIMTCYDDMLRRRRRCDDLIRWWQTMIVWWAAMITCYDDTLWSGAMMICYDHMLWCHAMMTCYADILGGWGWGGGRRKEWTAPTRK